MVNEDLITVPSILKRTLRIIPQLPSILEGFRLTKMDDPSIPVGLALEFEAAALDNPKGIAVIYENKRYTYYQMNQIANQFAHYLRAEGIQKGDVLGIYIDNMGRPAATA